MGSQLDPLPLFRVGSQERATKSQFPQLDFGKPSSGFHPVTWERVIGGVDVIMISDFYQSPHVKDSWIFQNIKNNVNALTLNFWQTYVQCYELNKIMK